MQPSRHACFTAPGAADAGMWNRLFGLFSLALSGLLVATDVTADSMQTARAEDVMEEVVITGKKPGPPLWEVVNGEHRLFIFGSLMPLPESFEWDSERVDWVIFQSAEFIEAPALCTGTRPTRRKTHEDTHGPTAAIRGAWQDPKQRPNPDYGWIAGWRYGSIEVIRGVFGGGSSACSGLNGSFYAVKAYLFVGYSTTLFGFDFQC
jgi:hypothetical protein